MNSLLLFIVGGIVGLVGGNHFDRFDILFPFRRMFLKRIKTTSYWQLIQMTNDIDNELEERRLKQESLRHQQTTKVELVKCEDCGGIGGLWDARCLTCDGAGYLNKSVNDQRC